MSLTLIRALIIDDEPMARELLESHCKQTGFITIVASCKSAVEAFQILHEQDIDVMFLDIQMPGITGLNFLRSLKNPPRAIFTTAYDGHAIEAFELEATDYLLKPVTYERFFRSVQRISNKQVKSQPVIQSVKQELTSIFLKSGRRLIQIELNEVLFFVSLGDYVKVITLTETLVCYTTLNKLADLLPGDQFLRVHRSYIVSLKRISFMEGNYMKIGEHDIPVGSTYKEGLMKKLNLKEDD